MNVLHGTGTYLTIMISFCFFRYDPMSILNDGVIFKYTGVTQENRFNNLA